MSCLGIVDHRFQTPEQRNTILVRHLSIVIWREFNKILRRYDVSVKRVARKICSNVQLFYLFSIDALSLDWKKDHDIIFSRRHVHIEVTM